MVKRKIERATLAFALLGATVAAIWVAMIELPVAHPSLAASQPRTPRRSPPDVAPAVATVGARTAREERTDRASATEREAAGIPVCATAVAGRVLAEDGRPIARALVQLQTRDGDHLTLTRQDGSFAIPPTPRACASQLFVEARGWEPHALELEGRHCPSLTVILTDRRRNRVLTGSVQNTLAQPVAAARVRLGAHSTSTDEDGRWSLEVEAMTTEQPLLIWADGFAPLAADDWPGQPDRVPRVDVLRPANQLRGRVVDELGNACSGWIVRVTDTTALDRLRPRSGCVEDQLGSTRQITDADGGFCFPNLADRTYRLLAHSDRGDAIAQPIAAAPGVAPAVLIATEPTPTSISGRVVDGRGCAVAGVTVAIERPGSIAPLGRQAAGLRTTTTDPDGQFCIDASAAYNLLAFGDGIVPRSVAAPADPNHKLTVRVSRRRELSVRTHSGDANALCATPVDIHGNLRHAVDDYGACPQLQLHDGSATWSLSADTAGLELFVQGVRVGRYRAPTDRVATSITLHDCDLAPLASKKELEPQQARRPTEPTRPITPTPNRTNDPTVRPRTDTRHRARRAPVQRTARRVDALQR